MSVDDLSVGQPRRCPTVVDWFLPTPGLLSAPGESTSPLSIIARWNRPVVRAICFMKYDYIINILAIENESQKLRAEVQNKTQVF